MTVSRKLLLSTAAAVAALFVIAFPLGDAHHGLGQHHAFVADLGEGVWVAFLIGAALLIVLAVVAAVQALLSRRT